MQDPQCLKSISKIIRLRLSSPIQNSCGRRKEMKILQKERPMAPRKTLSRKEFQISSEARPRQALPSRRPPVLAKTPPRKKKPRRWIALFRALFLRAIWTYRFYFCLSSFYSQIIEALYQKIKKIPRRLRSNLLGWLSPPYFCIGTKSFACARASQV